MAMVNPMLSLNVKDSRWLTLEVCREFTRQKCTRPEVECKYAHPPAHVEVQNGRVVCCFDSIKGKCQRRDPPCKYLHPPQHLREQVIQNGRNNLILKSPPVPYMMAGLQGQPMVPNMFPSVMYEVNGGKTVPYPSPQVLPGQYPSVLPQTQQQYILQHPMMSPYINPGMTGHPGMPAPPMMHVNNSAGAPGEQNHIIGTVPSPLPNVATSPITTVPASNKLPRADRLEPTIVTSIASNGSGDSGQSATAQWVGNSLDYTSAPLTAPLPAPLPTVASSQYSPLYFQVCREFQRGTCSRPPSECRFAHPPDTVSVEPSDNHVTVCMDHIKGKCSRQSCRYYHPPPHLQAQIKAAQQRANATATVQAQALGGMMGGGGMVPMVKRQAIADSKSGIPMYQPTNHASAMAYQQAALAMQMQHNPYMQTGSINQDQAALDVAMPWLYRSYEVAGHPPGVPRF